MKICERIFIKVVLLISLFGCAAGGARANSVANGVTNIGQARNITIIARQYVTKRVHIAGGHYLTPYTIKNANTEYILDGDITADGKAISIQASKVVVNLNGHTITYNQIVPGEGIAIDAWNKTDIAIINGSIVQDPSYDTKMPSTKLVDTIDSSQTSFRVADSKGFTVGTTIIIENEGMKITGVSNNSITVIRAELSTRATTHSADTVVYCSKSEGDVYGIGNNPVRAAPFNVDKLQVADLSVAYGGRDVGGIAVAASNSIFEHNTITDKWGVGTASTPHTLKNRMQGIDALTGTKNSSERLNNIYRNNMIINCRHRGLNMGNVATAYGNTIIINSMATNSMGIVGGYNSTVYGNSIFGRGEHPIGISFSGMGTPNALHDVEIYNNSIDVQTTRIGAEYSNSIISGSSTTVHQANYADGFRTTWGGNGIDFHDNVILARSDSYFYGAYSPTGAPAWINAGARGIEAMLFSGETARFNNNAVTVLDKDGTGISEGLVVTGYGTKNNGNNAGLVFKGNTVISNIANVALGDPYGPAPGWPLFIENTFIRKDNYPTYHTIMSGLGGYFVGTGKFVSNVYLNGASQSNLDMHFGNHAYDATNGLGWKSIIFGRLMSATIVNNTGLPIPRVQVTIHNRDSDTESVTADIGGGTNVTVTTPTSSTSITDSSGTAQFIVYDYELHDRGSNSPKPVRVTFRPHTVALFNQDTNLALFTTRPDASNFAWDALSGSGKYTLNDANGSIIISNGVGKTN